MPDEEKKAAEPSIIIDPSAPEAARKPEVIHRKTFEKASRGLSAQELHRKLVFAGKHCRGCGSRQVALRIKALAPAVELMKTEQGASFIMQLAMQNNGAVPVVDTVYGKFIRVSDVYACDRCAPRAEKVASKHPSSWIIEFDRGPGKDRPRVSVPRG